MVILLTMPSAFIHSERSTAKSVCAEHCRIDLGGSHACNSGLLQVLLEEGKAALPGIPRSGIVGVGPG